MKHGTQYAYRAHRCRCKGCRAWKASDARAYRQRRINSGWRMVTGKWVKTGE